MNARSIRTLMVKDWKEVAQNRGAWIPAVVVPFFFLVLLPLLIILVPTQVPAAAQGIFNEQFAQVKAYLAPFMGGVIQGLTDPQVLVVVATGYMLAPFLLIMPLMLSSIISAESFVGERERKTIEALIYTPASDAELFLAKVLAAVVPSVVLSWLSFVVYGIVVNAASWPVMGRLWFPPATWLPLMFWLAPALATLGTAVTVLISARVKSFMEAYQMSGSLVLLVLALVAGQASGVLFLGVGAILAVGAVVWAVDAVLIWLGIRTFARASLLARL
jgi:ABC-type transport system involved in multi-copper enzyme maturation permease subunit